LISFGLHDSDYIDWRLGRRGRLEARALAHRQRRVSGKARVGERPLAEVEHGAGAGDLARMAAPQAQPDDGLVRHASIEKAELRDAVRPASVQQIDNRQIMHQRRATVIVLAALTASAFAQAPAQDQVFKSTTRTEVPIYATVIDASGRLVPDLQREDFTVYDEGRPVELTQFSNDSQPFTAVVMMDTSASMTNNLELLNVAAEQFLMRLLPVDKAQVGAFNDKIQLSGTFTNDRDVLIDALDDLQFGNPTRLNDALGTSLDALKDIDGRRVVLLFTDGDDTASKTPFRVVLDRARNEEVMVYAIGLESEYFNGGRVQRTRPSRDLRKVADETGGGYFELKKTAELASTFTRVAQELRSQYLLGFAPATLDGKVHRLEVRTRRPNTTVRARKSYLATPDRNLTSR
jgi:Ca-activated chloride channel family protein